MPPSPDHSSSNRITIPPSSTCPSSSVFQIPSNRKSMEEVWKEIRLASLHDCSKNDLSSNTTTNTTHSAFRNLIFHEFLARPFNKDSPSIFLASSVCNPTSVAEFTFLSSLEQTQPALLRLSSGSDSQKQSHNTNTSFDALDSITKCPSNYTKKRDREGIYNNSDRRHKRMIKNRESAARSRARKKAYTNELEVELAHLREENARLRRQQEKFHLPSSAQRRKKRTLYRTLTAPF